MAGLIDEIEEPIGGGVWVSSVVGNTNDTGTPLLSIVPNYSGEALSDNYEFFYTDVDTVDQTATLEISASAPNNPYNRSGLAIDIDGATVHSDLLPGFDIVFSGSGSFSDAWSNSVRVGDYQGNFNAYEIGGDEGTARKHRVKNTDAGAAADCKVTLKTIAQLMRLTGHIFDFVKPYADGATEKIANDDPVDTVPGSFQIRPYRITVSSVTGVGAAKVGNFRVDGLAVNLLNLSSGLIATSDGVNVVDTYRIDTGGGQSIEFKLSEDMANGDTANILIFPARYTQIAPDVEGVAGTFGTSDVILTQTGEAAGLIQPEGVAYYWVKTVVPEGAQGFESNPYPGNVYIIGKQTGTAGWVA
jgi:hypothetical protein